ncbi:hypothetical protein M408DRAFT_252373 [Serendipita vermifera MAFF 305830]|uniref:Ras-GEF domain-containing protein n=1 Tax=Serendipita vermifera MAFF 305830 TaxID=933852 RepID=A0A0C3AG74_SERVB|nr:hypothetical protein M408DRAFT_252373 [Serendipita vermifera MAFF 305830]
MITFKTFATIDLVFDLLIERYDIQPPKGLTPEQLFEWTRVKKTPIRLRSINIMRKLIDVLEEEDLHVLDRVKGFCNDVVANDPSRAGVARALLAIVTRVETKGIEMKRTIRATSDIPPPSILPRKWGKFKLLDVDPLEMARQLTIMESELFVKVQQNECITRSKESVSSDPDSIKSILTVASKLADWVAKSILSKHDTTKRAATIKYFINVAERCRYLHNYSSMAALIAGLNSPPVRRLERTWENVSARNTAILDDLEKTLDTAHNFQGYKVIISSLQSPCVPFLGVCLTVLTFIPHDGNDILTESGLINFQKCQKIADVIQEIEKFQMRPYNLTKLANVRAFIDESLALLDDVPDLWQLSLEREPAEKEYEKTARLLQESGFL